MIVQSKKSADAFLNIIEIEKKEIMKCPIKKASIVLDSIKILICK